MSRNLRFLVIALVTVVGVVVLIIGGFGLDRVFHSDQILRNVSAGDVDLSGMTAAEAQAALQGLEDDLTAIPAPLTVNGTAVSLDPATVGFGIDEEAATESAMAVGRQGPIFQQFGWWWSHLFAGEAVTLPVFLDDAALVAIADSWETDHISDPPFDGAIELNGTTPVPVYPRAGRTVDIPGATGIVLDSFTSRQRIPSTVPIIPSEPALTNEDVDRAVATAERMLAGPVVLNRLEPPISVTFSEEDLAGALTSEVVTNSAARIEIGFDVDRVAAFLEPFKIDLELPPVDAAFAVNEDDTVSVIPGEPGAIIDPELATAALEGAALAPSRQGEIPFEDGAEPELTTEEAEAYGIKHLVSRFTTYHACCESRVDNIQLFADIVSGTIVQSGETLSLNELVGERTRERGFKPAGTIIRGKIVDTVGGGVSQFATTFYNAVFWGGYEDITHTAHSYYFSRYPEGIEATISWPLPNLEFKNNRDSAILITTSHTDTSITVSFYGDNGGRMLAGEQSGGVTRVTVLAEGDETSYQVSGRVSDRYSFAEPPIEYLANNDLEPDEERVVENGRTGWSVTVTRVITYPDGTEEEQTWPVRYRPQATEIQVHSCMLPEDHEDYTGEECPEPTTTTTTAIEETTSTTESTTTTTEGG